MKSIIFKSAWAIFRTENCSFSLALKKAWEYAKKNIKATIVKMNKQVKSTKWIGYETVYFNQIQLSTIKIIKTNEENKGAASYYGAGRYSGD